MEEALKRAERVIEEESADYKARLVEQLNALDGAIREDDLGQAVLAANTIKCEAGIFGWPLVSVVAGWLRMSLEAGSDSGMAEVAALQLNSLNILVHDDLRGEAPAGQKLVRGLYAVMEKYDWKGLSPSVRPDGWG